MTPNLPSTRRTFLGTSSLAAAALALGRRVSAAAADAASERKLGIALCGLGNYATGQLAPALRRTRHCELRGVVTGSPEKGRKWARDFGFPESHVFSYA
jgi:glucose-fructose oxidoreductase